ncbi:hypothetical protein Hdeb2414_s0027g00695091 [Helianthus debilis subsp. tardiflorus]
MQILTSMPLSQVCCLLSIIYIWLVKPDEQCFYFPFSLFVFYQHVSMTSV